MQNQIEIYLAFLEIKNKQQTQIVCVHTVNAGERMS